jgi:membrane complex biogenesis BtpA family protein
VIPALVGVIHLAPLPGSPRYRGSFDEVMEGAVRDVRALADAGFDAVLVENYGDAPFAPAEVEEVTVAAMTRCASLVHAEAPRLSLGVNVLRNDARAALAVALASGASFVRLNVHTGARLTDQGIVTGRAHDTLRMRRDLGIEQVKLLCDVAVKHSAPLAPRPIEEEARETSERGLADALLVTGPETGAEPSARDLEAVLGAVEIPVLIASGATPDNLRREVHGVVVGSWLRASGRAGDPIDPPRAKAFAEAFWQTRR